mmetsp:Transcript_124952/g.364957  ORF Transcript_124952/g.364957 Transcript_124952/m.364957 type:complete len:214 (-) Transcript_124952:102-743(-)
MPKKRLPTFSAPTVPVALLLSNAAEVRLPVAASVCEGLRVAADALGPGVAAHAVVGLPAPLLTVALGADARPLARAHGRQPDGVLELLALLVEPAGAVHALRPRAVSCCHALEGLGALTADFTVVAARVQGPRRGERTGPPALRDGGLPHLRVHLDAVLLEAHHGGAVHALRPGAVRLGHAGEGRGALLPSNASLAAGYEGVVLPQGSVPEVH